VYEGLGSNELTSAKTSAFDIGSEIGMEIVEQLQTFDFIGDVKTGFMTGLSGVLNMKSYWT